MKGLKRRSNKYIYMEMPIHKIQKMYFSREFTYRKPKLKRRKDF